MEPRIISVHLKEGIDISLVHIPGGEYLMGDDQSTESDEKPAHPVHLSDFYLGRFLVTQALWKAVMKGENPSYFKGDNRPVERVSWDMITKEFLPALKKLTDISFRLPTEAEWEYAARGGPHHKDGLLYAGSNKLKEVGWFEDNSHLETKPVGLKRPNQLGLYDMSGNVWEWMQDLYSGDYYKECQKKGLVIDPPGPEGVYRVLRGGGYWIGARYCRAASRHGHHPALGFRHYGFRLAASFQGGG